MSSGIFLIDGDDQLVELRETPYDSEDLLQRLLATHPGVLGSDEIDPENPRRWLLISRETSVPGELGGSGRWAVDHLFLDQDAIPTLVEVKRSTDTRLRREVVGQMLDYAANAVVYWPIEHLVQQFDATCRRREVIPTEEITAFVGAESDPSSFWDRAKTNLQAGRIRMIFVADIVPPELRRIVEFLNQQMDPAEVLAVEIKQFAGRGLRTLVPSVIGRTAEADRRKGPLGPKRLWSEESFFSDLSDRGRGASAGAARRLLAWATGRGLRVVWGKGQFEGSFSPVLDLDSAACPTFSVYTGGMVQVSFQWFMNRPPFDDEDSRRELRDRLNQIPGVEIPEGGLSRRPNVPLEVLARDGNIDHFIQVFDWFVAQVRTADRSDVS
jgi:hypothetical protein